MLRGSSPAAPKQRRASTRLRKLERSRRQPRHTEAGLLLELGAKLLVNSIVAGAAAASIVRLVPYAQAQQQELHRVQAAVAVAETQTSRLRTDFSRYFDPRQAGNVMQEQSGRELPSQRQIVWVNPTPASP